ncbi:MAG TPA: hypothetical protein PLW05_10580 [Candidatus Marinimicrobia bacterium]|nr:hypothetical protein [Candidatus Neomarinimicrobiota bacterium]HQE96296.1 hypothetical protein [Candidatus Neomarinimicrobiota bacterium]HQH56978.1 hypothetical protein [Candidatus Neomarinimicrobiota bacterium]HRS52820.1 hypothetical protein [Candidatus Neomarinimicrobiota bacterium]HRU45830.1 hypothetical protein [Candidatus Neomarinimicrobiota bacterium]
MSKQTTLKYLNCLMGIAFLGIIVSLFLLKTGIVTSDAIVEVHEIFGGLLILGIIGHLILNWKWVKQTYSHRKKDN